MDAGEVAFAPPRRLQSGSAAHGQKLRAHAALLQLAEQIVEADAVTANDRQIGELQFPAEQLYVDRRARLDDLLVAPDRRKSVGAAECGDAAGALSHRIGRQ